MMKGVNNLKSQILKIIPLDWVAFRAARSFSGVTNTNFPNAKTFYGAIYGEYFNQNKEKTGIFKEIKEKIENRDLEIIGPFLIDENDEIYLPTPAILKTSEKKYIQMGYEYEGQKNIINGKELNSIMYKKIKETEDYPFNFIPIKIYEKIKNNDETYKEDLKQLQENEKKLYETETKIGIALEKGKRKTEKGMLYSMNYYRFRDGCGFVFFIRKDKNGILKKIDTIKLGTKGKLAFLETKEKETNIFEKETGKRMNVLITNAVMENGIIPKKNITAVANKKYINIGFWDSELNKPSTLQRAVPAGAVYFSDESIGNISDLNTEYGFGETVELPIK